MYNFSQIKFVLSVVGICLLSACAQKSTSLIGTQDAPSQVNTRIIAPATDLPPASASQEIFTFVEQMPEFPGGQSAMNTFIAKNMFYPSEARENKEEGKVVVQFVVMKDGIISDANVVRSVSESIDKEALRVVSIMPRWQPGKQNGQPVNVRYMLPISFALN